MCLAPGLLSFKKKYSFSAIHLYYKELNRAKGTQKIPYECHILFAPLKHKIVQNSHNESKATGLNSHKSVKIFRLLSQWLHQFMPV